MGFILDLLLPMSGMIMRMMMSMTMRMVFYPFSLLTRMSILPSYLVVVGTIMCGDMGRVIFVDWNTVFREYLSISGALRMGHGDGGRFTAVACSLASADTWDHQYGSHASGELGLTFGLWRALLDQLVTGRVISAGHQTGYLRLVPAKLPVLMLFLCRHVIVCVM
jgi:hypothetical protein